MSKQQFRVKAFIFVNSNSHQEAEEIAGRKIGADTFRKKGDEVEQITIREGSAKMIILKEKHK